jgi:hypothetical protein
MRGRIAPWLAWSLAYVSLILCVAAILLFIPTLSVQTPSSWGTGGVSAVIVFLPLYFPEGRLPSRRWRPIAWFAVLRTLLAGSSASRASLWEPPSQPSFYADYSLIVRPGSLPGGDIAIWSLSWTAPVLSAAPTFVLLLFSGR